MRKKLVYIIPILLLFGCTEKEGQNIEYKIIKLSEAIPLSEDSSDTIHFHVSFNYLELQDYRKSEILSGVQYKLMEAFFMPGNFDPRKSVQENFNRLTINLTGIYRKEALALEKKFPKMAATLNYELKKNARVLYNKNKILTIELETFDYTGGAHGFETKEYLHFDMNSGEAFNLKELFDDAESKMLIDLVSEKCEEMKKTKNSEIFEESSIESCGNFYFDDDNFYFVYNPYEIGPYSAGYITIKIPISKIGPLLKKNIQPGFMHQ